MTSAGTPPTLDVVIVHYHAPEWCRSSIESLLASQNVDVRITVVNNGGDLGAFPARVDEVRTDTNVGYAGGMNVGLRRWLDTGRPYCLVGAHDLHVEPSTAATLLRAAERAPDYGIVAPWFTPRVARVGELGEADGLVEFEWVSGSGFLLRRQGVLQFGLFDEDFGSYGEDHEICLRAREQGWRVGVVRDAPASSIGSAHHMRSVVMMHGNQILLAAKLGERGGVRAAYRAELGKVVDEVRKIVSPGHSTRRAGRFAWAHVRALAFGTRQVARWRRHGRPRSLPPA